MQIMSNGRVRRTESERQELLARWKKSGLSVREFCRGEKVQVSSFQRWQQRSNAPSVRKDFVTVMSASPALPRASRWMVEVVLPDGSKLRFQG